MASKTKSSNWWIQPNLNQIIFLYYHGPNDVGVLCWTRIANKFSSWVKMHTANENILQPFKIEAFLAISTGPLFLNISPNAVFLFAISLFIAIA